MDKPTKDIIETDTKPIEEGMSFDDLFETSDNFATIEEIIRSKTSDCLRYSIAFDATSSMDSYWEMALAAVQQAVDKIRAYKVSKPVEINIIAYRDVCDGSNIYEESGFSSDFAYLSKFIKNVDCGGGGDFPENVEKALEKTCNTESNMLILIGDAPSHNNRNRQKDGEFDGESAATKLGEQSCPIYALYIPDSPTTMRCFKRFAELSGGKAYALNNERDIPDMITTLLSHDKALIKNSMAYIPYMPTTEAGKAIAKDI